ncbi:uncharacterized protein LOC116009680 [Ipomoea triloba]|uniref:uncharacterized protein LOC116009680 n=1 Tax=Ipomoea triloba TaxID=35885 RepID=UPI00125E0A29|nr:uncharacterized protein LOC116009680 [Ipomoea triloba]
MDWVSWLSKSTLEPSLVYDYALTFAHNELNQEDIPFFNHEFLQSMGVSVAKHRLEILKLARKEKGRSSNSNSNSSSSSKQKILWLVFAVKQVRKNLAKQVRGWIRREDSPGSLTIVSARNCSLRWKAAMLKRKKTNNNQEWAPRMIANNVNTTPRTNKVLGGEGRLMMLTNGSPLVDHRDAWSYSSASSSPNLRYNEDEDDEEKMGGAGDGKYWSPTIEDIKWDSMFQNLKPT